MEPAVSLSAVKVGNTLKWSPGAVIRARHEGVGLSAMWFKTAERQGVDIRYDTAVVRLLQDKSGPVTRGGLPGPAGFSGLAARSGGPGRGRFEAQPGRRAPAPARP